jgi:hypothetical protein
METRSIKLVIETLNQTGIRYIIVGGLAVNAHGYFRVTNDLDLVVSLEPANIIAALHALDRIGFRPNIPVTPEQFANKALRESWVRDKNMVVFQLWSDDHLRTPVDIFVMEPFPFSEESARAVHQEIYPGITAPFVSLQTLLAMKRRANRARDMLDIENLRKLHPDA